jgi:hypothetical protein
MYAKPEAASAVLSSWWWAVCRPRHVELHINMNRFGTLVHLVGNFYMNLFSSQMFVGAIIFLQLQ